jgi:hypothetical protein
MRQQECAMVGCGQPAAPPPLLVDLASLPGPIEVPLCALCRQPFAEGFEDLAALAELDGADEIAPRESAA